MGDKRTFDCVLMTLGQIITTLTRMKREDRCASTVVCNSTKLDSFYSTHITLGMFGELAWVTARHS